MAEITDKKNLADFKNPPFLFYYASGSRDDMIFARYC